MPRSIAIDLSSSLAAKMDLPLAEDVQLQLSGFKELLGSLESKLQPFLGPGSGESLAQLLPLERAQAHLALAQATAALYQLYLRASGVDPADHETIKEQERLKQYSKKVRKVAAEKELRETRRSMEVNVAAVNRFITAAVPDLTHQQKAALRQASRAAATAKAGGGGASGGGAGAGASAAGGRKRKEAGAAGGDEGVQGAGVDASDAAAAFLEQAMAELQQEQGQEQGQHGHSAGGEQAAAAQAGAAAGSTQKKAKKQKKRKGAA